ncbi:MAG: hypothetical protein F6K16_38070 [Symploca sp. SIO2B6]|nr:hypothetical protein [Symploca sp. SIO2B6]
MFWKYSVKVDHIWLTVHTVVIASKTVIFKALMEQIFIENSTQRISSYLFWLFSLIIAIAAYSILLFIIYATENILVKPKASLHSNKQSLFSSVHSTFVWIGMAVYYFPFALPQLSLSEKGFRTLAVFVIGLGTFVTNKIETSVQSLPAERESRITLNSGFITNFFRDLSIVHIGYFIPSLSLFCYYYIFSR